MTSRAAQAADSSPRPPAVVSISPVSAIPPGVVSFDFDQQGEWFGYEFTRHFGELDDSRPTSCLRIHVVLLSSRGAQAIDSAVAFSFPLWLFTGRLDSCRGLEIYACTDLGVFPSHWRFGVHRFAL